MFPTNKETDSENNDENQQDDTTTELLQLDSPKLDIEHTNITLSNISHTNNKPTENNQSDTSNVDIRPPYIGNVPSPAKLDNQQQTQQLKRPLVSIRDQMANLTKKLKGVPKSKSFEISGSTDNK
ncbi:MAG: hypothetical protein EZS28_040998 [Streblomastix strix]|uniref:Uncharacterized protein n=1 Tax=Streblomastix strix TaxID=222440 RepID=A0A5J4U196_9EUKA|nr:MAG: hypothetical protein EZS28_040998 [Streblomastix strix]